MANDMEIIETITIDMLTKDSVSIVREKWMMYNEQRLKVGDSIRTSYENSEKGRELLKEEVKEPYLTSILNIWGDEPTVIVKEPELHDIQERD